jgi:hypothetical protein
MSEVVSKDPEDPKDPKKNPKKNPIKNPLKPYFVIKDGVATCIKNTQGNLECGCECSQRNHEDRPCTRKCFYEGAFSKHEHCDICGDGITDNYHSLSCRQY